MDPTPHSSIDLTHRTGTPAGAAADRVAAIGETLRQAFAEACETEGVRGRLTGPPAEMVLAFEAQDTASPALILDTFLGELETRGIRAGPRLRPDPTLDDARVRAAADAIRETVRRVRALMIEYNSYLSGGLPYVFPTDSELLRSRGLNIYRYPALAEVDVEAVGEAIRISFHPGALGEVTSSGFYVPTRVRGDFTAEVRFTIRRWKPGPDNACLALFAQDEPSLVRFYAQRFTEAGAPGVHLAQANLNGAQSEPIGVEGDAGAFRLTREGGLISSWYGDGDAWTKLGQTRSADSPDLFLGAKIWSGVDCGGLEADFSALAIDGEIPEEQPAAPVARPDPRRA
jgi:hypothetical protein